MTHVENALRSKQLGNASEQDVVLWATMILLKEPSISPRPTTITPPIASTTLASETSNGRCRLKILIQWARSRRFVH